MGDTQIHRQHGDLISLLLLFFKVGLQVLRVGMMNSDLFWDLASCSAVEAPRHFGATYCPHFQVEE
jgi:hypothetical protein